MDGSLSLNFLWNPSLCTVRIVSEDPQPLATLTCSPAANQPSIHVMPLYHWHTWACTAKTVERSSATLRAVLVCCGPRLNFGRQMESAMLRTVLRREFESEELPWNQDNRNSVSAES